MLARLQVQNFRCFETLEVEPGGGFNFFIGANGEGKTSILEAGCALLRLQSQRSATLAPLVRFGAHFFGVSGTAGTHELQFRYSRLRRKLLLDGTEQRTSGEYLRVGRVVSFANSDIELARGASEPRRRYIDFIGLQTEPLYRATLRNYERALRSRNALLKSPRARSREIAAYDAPLIEHGTTLSDLRSRVAARIAPRATETHTQISRSDESLGLRFVAGNAADFAAHLASSAQEEARLRQTIVGPHRDDLELLVNGKSAQQFASEGQQRTVALSLKIAQAQFFATQEERAPLLLIDDIFGELDPARRGALLQALPASSQKLVTATVLPAEFTGEAKVFELQQHMLRQID